MKNNRLVHYGALIVTASVLIWLGAELSKRIVWMLPYAIGVGVLLIVIGFFMEQQRKKALVTNEAAPPGT